MQIRDRIKELRRVKASSLRPHPRNWRTHPQSQRDALRGVLAEIGYADVLLARELEYGTLELIDGHLRAETTPDADVPVLVLDVNEQEAAKLLVLHDPLASMAETDRGVLTQLILQVETENAAVETVLKELSAQFGDLPPADSRVETNFDESYQVVVECASDDEQREVYEKLTGEGYRCRVLTL